MAQIDKVQLQSYYQNPGDIYSDTDSESVSELIADQHNESDARLTAAVANAVAPGAVDTAKLANRSVTRPKIGIGAVGPTELDPALLQNFGDIAVQAKFVQVDAQLADIAINVKSFGAVGDGITNDRTAIQTAINACPINGTVFFPPSANGYYLNNSSPGDTELLLITKPLKLQGVKEYSKLRPANTVPTTCDVIRMSPNMVYDGAGYEVDGISIETFTPNSRSARHAINLDTSGSGQLFKRLKITNCELHATGGWSVYTSSNPGDTNGCVFTSWIEKNLIEGGIYLNRAGDSLSIANNIITGYNGFYADLVFGSNSMVFSGNNFTARGGFTYRNGNNLKVTYNNFEVAYNPMDLANNAYIDIIGPSSDYLYTFDFVGNNLTYRGTAQPAVNGLRINKTRTANIEGNFLANNGGQIIVITNQAVNTHLGRNLYSCPSSEGYGYITDSGTDTTRSKTRVTSLAGIVELFQFSDGILNNKGSVRRDVFNQSIIEGTANSPAAHRYIYSESNTGLFKHNLSSARRRTTGGIDSEVDLAFILTDIFAFATQGFALYNGGDGSRKIQGRLAVPTTGAYVKGDVVFNNNPSPGGYAGWICTTSGTPGTWKGFGLIEA